MTQDDSSIREALARQNAEAAQQQERMMGSSKPAPARQAETWREVEEFEIIGSPEQVAAMFTALAKAKGEFQPIARNNHVRVTKEGRFLYEFDYADLGDIAAATDGALSKHGLAVIHPLATVAADDEHMRQRTILTHESGAMIVSVMRFKKGVDLQKTGSAQTYLARYGRTGMLGVASQTDDDGNAAIGNEATPQRRERQAPAPQQKGSPKVAPVAAVKPQEAPPKEASKTEPRPAPAPARSKSEPPPAAAKQPDLFEAPAKEPEPTVSEPANGDFNDPREPQLAERTELQQLCKQLGIQGDDRHLVVKEATGKAFTSLNNGDVKRAIMKLRLAQQRSLGGSAVVRFLRGEI